jgi:hypothetical protein
MPGLRHVAAARSSRIAVSVDDTGAGVLILFAPRILNYVVAAYLILDDVLGLVYGPSQRSLTEAAGQSGSVQTAANYAGRPRR